MMKPHKIPSIKGLKLWCPACSEEIGTTNKCKKYDTTASKCPNQKLHTYRVVVYEQGSNKRRVKIIKHKEMDLVIKEAVLFREEVKNGKYKTEFETAPDYQEKKQELTLIEAMTMYMAFLECKRGAEHTLRFRSSNHKKDLQRSIVLFAKSLKTKGIDPEKINIQEITQEHVGFYHAYLLGEKEYSNRTYNRYMSNLRGFFNYLNKHEGLEIRNPFNTVQKKPTHTNIKTIEPKDFNALLEIITQERGIQELSTGEKKNHWHPFLKEAFLLGLLTGLRREQLLTLRFSDIQETPDSLPLVILSNNLKVNRINNINETGDMRITPTPISPQLLKLLISMGYKEKENFQSDRYILAPDSKMKRVTLMNILSKSFSHYWKQLGQDVPKDLSFAHLRKTYITKMTLAVGDNARHITGHSNQEVLNKHYINKELIARVASNHSIFPDIDINELKRKEELNQLRIQQQQANSKEQGITQ